MKLSGVSAVQPDAMLGPRLASDTHRGCFSRALALRTICMFLRVVFKKERKKQHRAEVRTLWPFTKRSLRLRPLAAGPERQKRP